MEGGQLFLWVMLVFGGDPSPYVMGTWWSQDAQVICQRNTDNYNMHHHAPLYARCYKYGAVRVSVPD